MFPSVGMHSWRCLLLGAAANALVACGGDGGIAVIAPYWVSGGVVVSDLDGDGRDDVAMAIRHVDGPPPHPGYVDVRRQTTSGAFAPLQRHAVAADPWVLVAGDVDGDGRPDLVSASPMTQPAPVNAPADSGAVALLRQSAVNPGQFGAAQVLTTGGVANDVALSDVQGDGRTDLLVADGVIVNSRALWLTQLPAGAFAPPVPVCAGAGRGWSALAVGDLDGDGLADLVGVGGDRLWWCRAQAGGGIAPPAVLGGAAVRWWRQTAPGVFSAQAQGVADGARRVLVRDLDADGRPDLAVISTVYQTQANSTRITVLLQTPASPGSYAVSQVWEGPYSASFIAAGELTGDGRVDLVVDGPMVYPQSATTPGVFVPAGVVLP
jgi:hypothetical protein